MATASASAQKKPGYGERRGELVRAAIRVVAKAGIAGLSHRAVAAEAGVTHGLVRHHFGSMTALIAETLDTVLPESLTVNPVSVLLQKSDAAEEHLIETIDAQAELQVFEYEVLLASRHTPELLPLTEKLYQGYDDSVRDAFAAHGLPEPSEADVTLIVSAIEGLFLHRVTLRRNDTQKIRLGLSALRAVIAQAAAKP